MARSARDLRAQGARIMRSLRSCPPDMTDVVEKARGMSELLCRTELGTRASVGARESADRLRTALQRVDWAEVRRKSERQSREIQREVRELTADVDWARVGKRAGQVAALVAVAAATGELLDLDEVTSAAVDSALAGDVTTLDAGLDAGTVMAMGDAHHAVQMAYVDPA